MSQPVVTDSTMAPLGVESPISGFFWTWVLPVLLFVIATGATWMLYRHFSKRGRTD